jgi:energy-coupling factor transport system permease protein
LPEFGSLSPTQEGLWLGLLRVTALCGIVAAVYLLLATTARGELVAGLLWFGRPLRRIGIDDRRFAVRLVLALEAVPQVQDLARDALAESGGGSRLQRLGGAAAQVLQASLAHAEQATGEIAAPDPQPVPLWQWALPVALAALLIMAAHA